MMSDVSHARLAGMTRAYREGPTVPRPRGEESSLSVFRGVWGKLTLDGNPEEPHKKTVVPQRTTAPRNNSLPDSRQTYGKPKLQKETEHDAIPAHAPHNTGSLAQPVLPFLLRRGSTFPFSFGTQK